MMKFPVVFGQENVGTAEVCEKGLYYDIRAMCRLAGQVPCRLMAGAGEQILNLGVLVPTDGTFCLETKVARKKLCHGELSFWISGENQTAGDTMTPLRSDEPFPFLEKLMTGYLRIVGDRMYFTD